MIYNRAILNTMTSIRLAGEVVNYLSKEAWVQFRKQNRVTAFFDKEIVEESRRTTMKTSIQHTNGRKPLPRKNMVYIPHVMANMMLATTSNITSVHFGMDHVCKKHNCLFTLEHIEQCDALSGCQDIRKYANKLKE